ncbi:MAG: GNAT family N-acetyltransferase [Bacteriovoracaceae bacterium]
MGNNFPRRTTLKESPSLFEETLRLIEKSFHYKKPFSFQEDFAPLMDPSNHHNCFVYTDENNKVIAHIGMKDKILRVNNHDHMICLLGGIAVDEVRRGEGLFRSLMEDVLSEKRSDCAFFLLWSDQEKLYQKFGFTLCGSQYEYSKSEGESHFEKTKFHSLVPKDKESLRELFTKNFATTYLTPQRSNDDWAMIEKTVSADLYIKRDKGIISSYFFMNKGQDLTGIIYEYGYRQEIEKFVSEVQKVGTVWTATPVSDNNTQQFQFMLAPADRRLFAGFMNDYTKGQFAVRDINLIKGEVYFDFNDETLSLEIPEFLRGVLGPGTFEELGDNAPLFLSGLDSI